MMQRLSCVCSLCTKFFCSFLSDLSSKLSMTVILQSLYSPEIWGIYYVQWNFFLKNCPSDPALKHNNFPGKTQSSQLKLFQSYRYRRISSACLSTASLKEQEVSELYYFQEGWDISNHVIFCKIGKTLSSMFWSNVSMHCYSLPT